MRRILSLIFLCFGFAAKADNWVQKASYPGNGQELPISFSIDDKGYVGCGTDAHDFWQYDPGSDSWTQMADVPGGNRRAGVGFSIGGKGYVGTGLGPPNGFYEYDPVANSWTAKASLPTARSFATGFSIGNKGYIGCGQSPFMSDFWEYDPSADSWTQKSSLPFPRSHSIGFSILGKGYIATGLLENGSFLNDIWEYDPLADTWTQKTDLPADGRDDARGFVICDKGYIVSGGDGPWFDELWQFDPVTNQWVQKTDFPGGVRDDGASFAIGNKGYFGLGQLSGTANTNDFWEYSPDDTCSTNMLYFSTSDSALCEKFCINFSDSSTNNPTAWYWIFSGGEPSFSNDQNPTNICYDVPGVYDVTLITTNANGSDTLTLHNYITVYPTPPIPTITQNDYTLTSSVADFYQWQLDAVDIPGATNQSYDVLQTGFYTVIVSDTNSCKNSTTLYVEITGIDEVNDGSVSIYPNPSSGNLFVEFMNEEFRGEVSIDVVNSLGQKIYSSSEIISSSNNKKEITLVKFTPGVYFIEVKSSGYLLRRKIILLK